MNGVGRIFKRGQIWWIAYSHRGKEFRESSKSTKEAVARRLLRKRFRELGGGKFIGPAEERVTFKDLAEDFLRDYTLRGLRSKVHAKIRVAHLRAFLGMDRAIDITTARIRVYIEARLEDKAAPSTGNRELGALSRMFTLAVQGVRLSTKPHIPRLEEPSPRQVFFEHSEYLAIRDHLEPTYQDILDFGYHSGWRRGEIIGLKWGDVDRSASIIRLRPELSKNKDSRVLALSSSLREVIERRFQARQLNCLFVFHRNARPISDWRCAWKSACKAAGPPGKLFHDLRRSVVRNLTRAGVPEGVAMAVTGHKTRSVFDRYNIVSEDDLKRATDRLAEYVAEQSGTLTVLPLSKGLSR